jgi:predicted restriction endonuclease
VDTAIGARSKCWYDYNGCYNGRCALSGLPEPLLLDAAHIVADKDEQFGRPAVPNGIPLSKIHHDAFDAHLIGIDPDYRLHVSDRLLGQNDGPQGRPRDGATHAERSGRTSSATI